MEDAASAEGRDNRSFNHDSRTPATATPAKAPLGPFRRRLIGIAAFWAAAMAKGRPIASPPAGFFNWSWK